MSAIAIAIAVAVAVVTCADRVKWGEWRQLPLSTRPYAWPSLVCWTGSHLVVCDCRGEIDVYGDPRAADCKLLHSIPVPGGCPGGTPRSSSFSAVPATPSPPIPSSFPRRLPERMCVRCGAVRCGARVVCICAHTHTHRSCSVPVKPVVGSAAVPCVSPFAAQSHALARHWTR
jgi:hypothetical protein